MIGLSCPLLSYNVSFLCHKVTPNKTSDNEYINKYKYINKII